MHRRDFLRSSAATLSAWSLPGFAQPSSARYQKLLILIELKGANDGLNTLVPYTDPAYAKLRPNIALKREHVLQLSEQFALHPSLDALLPLWQAKELAIVHGVGYPAPNQSHFRSIEIWDTASRSDEYLAEGWLARAFALHSPPEKFAANGVVVGSPDLGPLAGGPRAIALQSIEAYLRQAKLADPHGRANNTSLQHILHTERDIAQSAKVIAPTITLKTSFPNTAFGTTAKTAMHVVAGSPGVAALRLTLGGFDTHINQLGTHQGLLKQVGDAIAALRAALLEMNRWNDTLVMTYCEFGRRAKENLSNGTDHGTANVQFACGGNVKGGFYGDAPNLSQLNADGNLMYTIDFRRYFATALAHWDFSPSDQARVLNGNFRAMNFV